MQGNSALYNVCVQEAGGSCPTSPRRDTRWAVLHASKGRGLSGAHVVARGGRSARAMHRGGGGGVRVTRHLQHGITGREKNTGKNPLLPDC